MIAMHVTKGNFGDVDLSGVTFAATVRWPGPIHEGNGEMQPMIDERATEEQRNALFEAFSGKHGDSLFEVMAFVCPTIHEPVFAPIDFGVRPVDAQRTPQGWRRARGRGGDAARDRTA